MPCQPKDMMQQKFLALCRKRRYASLKRIKRSQQPRKNTLRRAIELRLIHLENLALAYDEARLSPSPNISGKLLAWEVIDIIPELRYLLAKLNEE